MGPNSDVVHRLTDEAFITGNFDTWDEIVAADLVDNDPMPGLPPNGEGIKMLASTVLGTFEDRKIGGHLEAPDGRVVENWVFTGKHPGEAMGILPSGRRD
jgi:predicted ester cyclase